MSKTVYSLALLVILSGAYAASQERPFPIFEGPYAGQTPPGMVPQRFAPGFMSTAGYDLTPTFSPGLDEVFFGRRSTEGGSDNKLYQSQVGFSATRYVLIGSRPAVGALMMFDVGVPNRRER